MYIPTKCLSNTFEICLGMPHMCGQEAYIEHGIFLPAKGVSLAQT